MSYQNKPSKNLKQRNLLYQINLADSREDNKPDVSKRFSQRIHDVAAQVITPETQQKYFQKRFDSQNKKRTDEPKRGRTPQGFQFSGQMFNQQTDRSSTPNQYANKRGSMNFPMQMLKEESSPNIVNAKGRNLLQNYMTANLSQLIKRSRQHQNQSIAASYDQHGRRSTSRQSPDEDSHMEHKQKIIEEQYSKFSKQYDKYFTSQGIQLGQDFQNSRGSVDFTERPKSKNNDYFQNNINNSMILLLPGKEPLDCLNTNMDSLLKTNLSRIVKDENSPSTGMHKVAMPKINTRNLNKSVTTNPVESQPSQPTMDLTDGLRGSDYDSMQDSIEDQVMLMKLLASNLQKQKKQRHDLKRAKSKKDYKSRSPKVSNKMAARRLFDPSPISEIITEKPEDSSQQKTSKPQSRQSVVKEFVPVKPKEKLSQKPPKDKKLESQTQKVDIQANELKKIRRKRNKIEEATRALTKLLAETNDEETKNLVYKQIQGVVKPQEVNTQSEEFINDQPIDVQIFNSEAKQMSIQESPIHNSLANQSVELQLFEKDRSPEKQQEISAAKSKELGENISVKKSKLSQSISSDKKSEVVRSDSPTMQDVLQFQAPTIQEPSQEEIPEPIIEFVKNEKSRSDEKPKAQQRGFDDLNNDMNVQKYSEAKEEMDAQIYSHSEILLSQEVSEVTESVKSQQVKNIEKGSQIQLTFKSDSTTSLDSLFSAMINETLAQDQIKFDKDEKQIKQFSSHGQTLIQKKHEIKSNYTAGSYTRFTADKVRYNKMNETTFITQSYSDHVNSLKQRLVFDKFFYDADREFRLKYVETFRGMLLKDIQDLNQFKDKVKRTSLAKNLFGDLGYEIDNSYLPQQNSIMKINKLFKSNFTKQIIKKQMQLQKNVPEWIESHQIEIQRENQKKKTGMLNQFVNICQEESHNLQMIKMDYEELILHIQVERKSFLHKEKILRQKEELQKKIQLRLERKMKKNNNKSKSEEQLTFGLRVMAKNVLEGAANEDETHQQSQNPLAALQNAFTENALQKGNQVITTQGPDNDINIQGFEFLLGQRDVMHSDSEDYDFSYNYQKDPYIMGESDLYTLEKDIIVHLKFVNQLQIVLLNRIKIRFLDIFCRKKDVKRSLQKKFSFIKTDSDFNQLSKFSFGKIAQKQLNQQEVYRALQENLDSFIVEQENQQLVYRTIVDDCYALVGGKHVVFVSGESKERIVTNKRSRTGQKYKDFGYNFYRITDDFLDYKSEVGSLMLESSISQASMFENLDTIIDVEVDNDNGNSSKLKNLLLQSKTNKNQHSEKRKKEKGGDQAFINKQLKRRRTKSKVQQIKRGTLFESDVSSNASDTPSSLSSEEESSDQSKRSNHQEKDLKTIIAQSQEYELSFNKSEYSLMQNNDEDDQILVNNLACNHKELMEHLKLIILKSSKRQDIQETLKQVQYLIYSDLVQCSKLFATNSVRAPQMSKMDSRKTIQQMELLEFRIEGNLGNIFDSYNISSDFNHLSFDESQLDTKVSQSNLSRERLYFENVTMKKMKPKLFIDSSFDELIENKINLAKMINEIVVPKQNFEQFVANRLQMMSSETINRFIQTIFELNLRQFWANHKRLEFFLWQGKKPKQYNMQTTDLDYLELQSRNRSLIQKELGQDRCDDSYSISSSCDGSDYNNIYSHMVNHLAIRAQNILKGVVMQKNNSQYQIYKILSQNKSNKLKNNIILCMDQGERPISPEMFVTGSRKNKWKSAVHTTQISTTNYVEQVEIQLKLIKTQQLKYIKEKQIQRLYMQVPSDCSSEDDSDASIEQTAKYIFIENIQKKHQQEKERLKKIKLKEQEKKRKADENRLANLKKQNFQKLKSMEKVGDIATFKKKRALNNWMKLKLNLREVTQKIKNSNKSGQLTYDVTKSNIFNFMRDKFIKSDQSLKLESLQSSQKKKNKKIQKFASVIDEAFQASGHTPSPLKRTLQRSTSFEKKKRVQFSGSKSDEEQAAKDGIMENLNLEFNAGFRYGRKHFKQTGKNERNVLPDVKASALRVKTESESDDHDDYNYQANTKNLLMLTNGCLLDLSYETQPFFNITFDGVNMKQQKRLQVFVQNVQSYYLFVKDYMLAKSAESHCFHYPYQRKPRLFEHQINKLQKAYQYDKILEQKRVNSELEVNKRLEQKFEMDISNPHTARYVNPFEIIMVDSKGQLLDDSYLKADKAQKAKEQERHKRLLTKKATYVTAVASQQQPADLSMHKIPNYKQGGKTSCFKLHCKLVSNGKFSQNLKLEKQINELGDNMTTDVECFSASLDPDSGFPLYWLFEIIEVVRKRERDLEIERQDMQRNLIKQTKRKLNFLEVRQTYDPTKLKPGSFAAI